MASIMEDEDLDVDVNIDVENVAEDVEEDIEEEATAEEATEAEAESEETDTAVQMTLRKFSELENALDHVKQYGVDRSFVSLMNYNDTLGRVLHVSFPSVESMDATGDPYSKLSKNTIAGLEAVLTTAWEWIKQLCEKIINAFKKAATWVVDLFQGYERKLKALDKQATDSKDMNEWNKEAGSETYIPLSKIRDVKATLVTINKSSVGLQNLSGFRFNEEFDIDKIDEDSTISKSELKTTEKASSNVERDAERAQNALSAAQSKLHDNVKLSSISGSPLNEAKELIKEGFDAVDNIKDARRALDYATKTVQNVKMAVARLDSKKQTKGRSRAMKYISSKLSRMQRIVSLQINLYKTVASTCIKSASKILNTCCEEEETN